ncbi:MAG: alpha/beta fold hydrolase [Eubacteriales bacterium]|nr:alpha/beta fold hydrolase [Eubacteriales bacterium]
MKKRFKTLVKLAIWTSIAMYLVNKFVESSATIHHLLKSNDGNFYNWKHGDIFYTVSGTGSPVVLIHDLNPTSSQYEWNSIIKFLSSTHTVYAIDLLGCGRSDKPGISYVNYLFVQLLHDFIEDIIGQKTDVIATGKSSSFVIMTAKLYPDIIDKITMINPESFTKEIILPDWKSKAAKAILDCPLLGVSLYYILTSNEQIEYNFCEKYFYNPFHFSSKTIQTYYESAHTQRGNGRHLLASIVGNYVNFDIKNSFSSIENDIHIIFGKELSNADKIAESYKKCNSSVTCSLVEKTKMLPQLEAPDKFLSYL